MGLVEGAALIQWVGDSCAAQGLPLAVTDPGVIANVCALLTGRAPGPERSRATPGPGAARIRGARGA